MAWLSQTADWEAYMLRSLAGPAQQSHSRVTTGSPARSEHFANYRRQQLQSILSNVHATGYQAQPRFVQSNQQIASILLAHSQQTYSRVAHNHPEMHAVQRGCDSGLPNVPTDLLQQWRMRQQNLCVPIPRPLQVDHSYNYNTPAQSPLYLNPLQLAYQAGLQQSNGAEPAFRRPVMRGSLGSQPTATSARPSASIHTSLPGYSPTYIANNHLYGHEMIRGSSTGSGYSPSPLRSPEHLAGLRLVNRYGVACPTAAPLDQPLFSAVQHDMSFNQERRDQNPWQGRQGNEREQSPHLTLDNNHLPPPKRQRVEIKHNYLGQLFADQQIPEPSPYDQDNLTARAQVQPLDHTPITRPFETANRASPAANTLSIGHTHSQLEFLDINLSIAQAQQQQQQFTSRETTVDNGQNTLNAAQGTIPNWTSVHQPILIPHERQQHVETPVQSAIAPCTEPNPPPYHFLGQDRLPVIVSSSPKPTELPKYTSQQLLTSIPPQVAPVTQAPTPRQHCRQDARSAGKDNLTQKLQDTPQTTPKARPKASKRSRKKPSPPKPKSVHVHRPVQDATELGVIGLQSFCRPYGWSEDARRDTDLRNRTQYALLQGTHRSSRHFKCTCAYPVPTCFAPEDPLGCPKQIEAEQRMDEANRGRDRCLEVHYIGSRSREATGSSEAKRDS